MAGISWPTSTDLYKRLRQRRVLHDRDQILDGLLADSQRQIIFTFGYHHRRRHRLHLVAYGHGEVSRVDDHGGRGGHLAHHAAAEDVALQTADFLFHLRVAVGFLAFVANLLLAHPHLLLEAALLPEQVDRAPDHEDVHGLPQQISDRGGDALQAGIDGLKGKVQECGNVVRRHRIDRVGKHGQQDQSLKEISEILPLQIREVFGRVEPLQIGSEFIEGESETGDGQMNGEAGPNQHGRGHDQRIHEAGGHQVQQLAQGRRRQLRVEAAGEDHAGCLDKVRKPASAVVRQQHEKDQELDAVDELLADGELAVLAGFFELPRGGFLGLLALVRHQSPASRIRADTPWAAIFS